MKYSWVEYQKAKEIVKDFEQERSKLSQIRHTRRTVYYGYCETSEDIKLFLKVRIWLKREYLANEIKNMHLVKWDENSKIEYLNSLKKELLKLRKEYKTQFYKK